MDTEPGNHLIEDQDYPMLLGELPNGCQVTLFGEDAAAVAENRFHDDAGDFIALPADCFLERGDIVPRQQNRVGPGARIQPW